MIKSFWRATAQRELESAPAPATRDARLRDAIGSIAEQASDLGRGAAEVDGAIEDAVASGTQQVKAFDALSSRVEGMVGENRAIQVSTEASKEAVGKTRQAVEHVGHGVLEAMSSLREVAGAATDITQIALQTRLVAFNATVEAKRAGEAGAGFAIVADAVKDLAGKVESSSKMIMATVTRLEGRIDELVSCLTTRQGAVAQSDLHQALASVEKSVQLIAENACRNVDGCAAVLGEVASTRAQVAATAAGLQSASAHTKQFLAAAEMLIELTADCDAVTVDTPYIQAVTAGAETLSGLLESAVASGRITMDDLFDERYVPLKETHPQQHVTRFVKLADELFTPIQEELLAFNSKVIFCVAVDRNGYLPTHNLKFSKRQGSDPVWNAANCRNRRIFNDRTGLAAGRNKRRFLLQTYRRDMGGGQRVLMKDLSAPITVHGRHWGGLRLGYSF